MLVQVQRVQNFPYRVTFYLFYYFLFLSSFSQFEPVGQQPITIYDTSHFVPHTSEDILDFNTKMF